MSSERTRERFRAVEEYVRSSGRGRWLILTHDNPDPDSIAAADALAMLIRKSFRRPVTIAYGGIIGRAENREMVRQLKLRLSPIQRLKWSHYKHFALVDTQPGTGNNQLPPELTVDLVIDHHPVRKATYKAKLFDVRPEYGASATILAEYVAESGLTLNKQTATALVYAIRTETQDFAREFAPEDRAVYDQLLPRVDTRAIARIQSPPLPLDYLDTLHQALERLEEVKTLVVSHLDTVAQPDIVPEIADLLLRLEGKTWSLCTGVFAERVYLSIRTTNPRANAGAVMRRLLGRKGKGGGHGMMAGGWLPLPASKNGNPPDVRALQVNISQKLARALRKDPTKIRPLPLRPGSKAPESPDAAPEAPIAEKPEKPEKTEKPAKAEKPEK